MISFWTLCLFLSSFSVCLSNQITDAENPTGILEDLFEEYFNWKLKISPQRATILGFNQHSDQIDDYSLDHLQTQIPAACEQFRKRAARILVERANYMTTAKKHQLRVLIREVSQCHEGAKLMGYLLPPINFVNGIQVSLLSYLSNEELQKLESLQDFKILLQRAKKIPKQTDQIIELLQLGIQEDLTYPRESLSRIQAQFDDLKSFDLKATPVYKRFEKLVQTGTIYPAAVMQFQREVEMAINWELLPAFNKLENFILSDYSLHLRSGPGLLRQTTGLGLYQGLLEYHTTLTGITPEDLYAQAVDDIRVMKENISALAEILGYGSSVNPKDFILELKNSYNQNYKNGEEQFQDLKSVVQKIKARLGLVLGQEVLSLPGVIALEVAKGPLNTTSTPTYKPASLGNNLNMFDMNNLAAWNKFETVVLALHETLPGHLLQTIVESQPNLPDFLKHPVMFWFMPGAPAAYNAFREGWALYAEFLGKEMNVYEPSQLIGYYSKNLVRAAKIAVDTGIHFYGWSKKKALDFMLENTPLRLEMAEFEVDRCITSPGEAAAGKTGERHILNLRQTLETEPRDDNFNLRLFHNAVLECLGPLDFLEDCVRAIMNPKKNILSTANPNHITAFTTTMAPGTSKTTAPIVINNLAVNLSNNYKLLVILSVFIMLN